MANIMTNDQANILATGFIRDPKLGHRLLDGQDFIGEKDFITLEQQLKEIKKTNKKVVLNIGDSSTSGWDASIYLKNIYRVKKGLKTKPAFFQYKTYTDILRDKIGDQFIVINAGVPAYSSLQGAKRLESLLHTFKEHRINVSYVTSYFGNNDSIWWLGGEDKLWVGATEPNIGMPQHHLSNRNQAINRVLPEDYRLNLISILTLCRSENIVPIFIEPLTSIYWQPGVIDKDKVVQRSDFPIKAVKELLEEAVETWKVAMKETNYSKIKQLLLEEAREKDYLLGRIKKSHLKVLQEVVSKAKTPYVVITLDRSQDDGRYFLDACHPIGDANIFLADGIKKVIMDFEQGKRKKLAYLPTASQFFQDSSVAKSSDAEELQPLTQYPLF
jgi:hypothetical protein